MSGRVAFELNVPPSFFLSPISAPPRVNVNAHAYGSLVVKISANISPILPAYLFSALFFF